jgi:UDP-glucose 4-epimerase|tara:strand:+ start:26176 stop:27081 length:906 start_codon:yes stop_codon:yes gene_type:complete
MSKCLVTGGCGFIGSNLVDHLIELGNDVHVIDDLSAASNDEFYFNNSASYYKLSISHRVGVEKVFKKIKPDYVFHLAAFSRIQVAMDNPLSTCDINFTATASLLQLCVEHEVKRFVLSSTSSVYGLKNQTPLNEEMNADCLNIYSTTKYGAEQLCKMYFELHNLPTIIFRYFNVYGPREPTKGVYAPVVGLFLKQFKAGKQMTIVGDGSQTRDFTHVKDVVRANVLAVKHRKEDSFGQVFNVGSGKSYSVLDLAERVGGPYKFVEQREGEALHTLANITKIRKKLEWSPSGDIMSYIDSKK